VPSSVSSGRLLPAFGRAFLKNFAVFSVRAATRETGDADRPSPQARTDAPTAPPDDTPHGRRPSAIDQAKAFIEKFGRDWCTNFAGMLAYNFLGAIFPLILGILALAALFLPISMVHAVGNQLNGAIPAAANGSTGLNVDFNNVLDRFRSQSGLAAIIAFVLLLWTGSNLFGVMENCFSIIFRPKNRGFVWQKLMSVLMIVIFAILAPLAFAASSISGSYQRISSGLLDIPGLGWVLAAGGYIIGVIVAFVLFWLIYMIVPNLELGFGHAWRGAIVAAILFEAASLIFPVYTSHQGTNQFGSTVALLGILTFWFWIVSLILLLGAEINSFFALGQRATADDLPGVVHGMKVHGEMRRGDDASSPEAQERVMEDAQPPDEKRRAAGA